MKKCLFLCSSFLIVILLAVSAHAVPTLRLTQGATVLTIADGSALDANPAAGAVTYIGSVGTFIINVSTGLAKPATGSAAIPFLDLNSVNRGTGGLRIEFSELDYTGVVPGWLTDVGGTLGDLATGSFQTWLDASNGLFGQGTQVGSLGPFGSGAFSGTDYYVGAPLSTPYALTLLADLSHLQLTTSSFDLHLQPLPEPATMLLTGLGLLGLGAYLRRRSKKA